MITPKYEFSKKKIKECYQYMLDSLPLCKLFYAVKANGNEKVLEIINEMGMGFECASTYEFDRVKKLGVDSSRIFFGLPIKTIETIEYTYKQGCRYYVFDSMRELHKLEEYAPEAKKICRIKISDIIVSTIIYGMQMQEIYENAEELKSKISGVSFHISYNSYEQAVQNVCDRLEDVLDLFQADGKKYIVNIGGGYSVDKCDSFYKMYNERLRKIQEKYHCIYYAEPGKSIVEASGSFFCKVISAKKVNNKTILYLDGGIANGLGYETFLGTVENCNINCACTEQAVFYELRDCTNLNETLITFESKEIIEIGDIIRLTRFGAYSIVFQNSFHMWNKSAVEIVE